MPKLLIQKAEIQHFSKMLSQLSKKFSRSFEMFLTVFPDFLFSFLQFRQTSNKLEKSMQDPIDWIGCCYKTLTCYGHSVQNIVPPAANGPQNVLTLREYQKSSACPVCFRHNFRTKIVSPCSIDYCSKFPFPQKFCKVQSSPLARVVMVLSRPVYQNTNDH